MRTRRTSRPLVAGLLLAAAVSGLAGCRTSPNVAAYVGDSEISVSELESAVDSRLENQDVATYAEGQGSAYPRQVLGRLVQAEVHTAAAERYGVEVSDRDVDARIVELLAGADPETAFAQAATQGFTRADIEEGVREQLLRERIAESEGLAEGTSEEELRARYEREGEDLAQPEIGIITVRDQATADQVLAQLTADPASYPRLAAQYAGPATLPELQVRSPEQLPGALPEAFASAEPGTGFAEPVPEAGGVVVGFVSRVVTPSFEEVRPQLEQEARSATDEAAAKLVDEVRDDLDVTINPRYGVMEEGEIRPADGGVVDILEGEGDAAGNGGTGG